MAGLPTKISDAVRKLNPHIFGGDAVRPVATSPTERPTVQALDGGKPQRKSSKGRVAVIVTLVSCRRRLTDDDAIAASCKPLRDAIAASLGIDDGDARIRFEYAQCRTDGRQGVMVKIETLTSAPPAQ